MGRPFRAAAGGGRGIGLIETVSLIGIVDAVGMLKGSPAWRGRGPGCTCKPGLASFSRGCLKAATDGTRRPPRTITAPGTTPQVASFRPVSSAARSWPRRVLHEAAEKRIAQQIEPDGRQPLELARTKSFGYSVMNLRGMFTLATLGERVGVELWSFQT